MTNRLIQLMRSQQHRPIHPTGVTIKAKKRTHAKVRTRGNPNRRLITYLIDHRVGMLFEKTQKVDLFEKQYHFTKGYRTRAA